VIFQGIVVAGVAVVRGAVVVVDVLEVVIMEGGMVAMAEEEEEGDVACLVAVIRWRLQC